MNKLLAFIAVFTALAASPLMGAQRAKTTDDDLYHASCRVQTGNVSGSGCIFHQTDDGDLWVLTNYHVAGNNDCDLDFVIDGKIVRVKGQNVWRGYDTTISLDAVILRVSAQSVANISDKLRYVPMYTGDSLSGEETMTTSGSPSARYPKKLEGRIRFDGSQNATFYPTPYGGQSGSSIFIQRNGRYYIGALLTWRTMDEGREEYGGLAQPITRVVSAMHGETALESCPVPVNAVECPIELEKGTVILSDGTFAHECTETIPDIYLEAWSIAGCQACEQGKREWLNGFAKKESVAFFRGDTTERDEAIAIGITSYPTYRLIHNGCEDGRWVGYSKAVAEQIEAKFNIIRREEKAREVQRQLDEDIAKFQGRSVAPACGRFPFFDISNDDEEDDGVDGASVSPFRFFSLPKDDENDNNDNSENEDKNDKIGRQRLFPILPKIEKRIDEKKDEYLGDLDGRLKRQMGVIGMWGFLMVYCACALALLTYKAVGACFKGVWQLIKNAVFSFNRTVANGIASQLDTSQKTDK